MISTIIPVYKNTEEFIRNFKKNLPYLKETEIIIVNDDPDKSIKTELSNFRDITLIENKVNIGFGQTVNKGVLQSKFEYIFLLNSDVILKDSSYNKSASQFAQNNMLFGISFAQIEKDKSIVGKNRYYWKSGFFYHSKASDMEFGFNGWAEGGSCLIDKKKFLELKGFNPLYTPFYWEDIDLSYRAWKIGYKVVFDPDILVEHHHGGTTDKYIKSSFKETTAARNHYIFIWKNITDINLLLQHIVFLPFNLLYFAFKGNVFLLKGFFFALVKLPKILNERKNSPRTISDKDVLGIIK